MSADPDLTIPGRECPPWCTTGDGHGDAHPEDRMCWSPSKRLPMTGMEPVKMGDGTWWYDYVDVVAWNRPELGRTEILIGHEDSNVELKFTLDEAGELAGWIADLLVLVEGSA